MSVELFEKKTKKKGRPKKEKISKLEKNKKQLKEMTDQIEENQEDKKSSKRASGIARYEFKCPDCGTRVTLEGDHPDFSKLIYYLRFFLLRN